MARWLFTSAFGSLLALSALSSSAHAALVWYEYGVASATGGYDPRNNQTLINKFYVAAFGPDSVETELRNYIRDCVRDATIAAANTFQQTPGEVGIRISAAYGTFHGGLSTCLSARGAAKAYISKFEIGYIRRGYWEPGLHLKFTAENPSTQAYLKLHNAVKDKLPDPVNKLIVFYINSQQPLNFDVKLNPPRDVARFLEQLPEPPDLRRFSERAEEEARKSGQHIAEDVKREAQQAGHRLGSEAAKIGQQVLVTPVTIAGEAAKGARQIAPNVIDAVSPIQQSNGKTTVKPTGPFGPTVTKDGNSLDIKPPGSDRGLKIEIPKIEPPKIEAPKIEAPKVNLPKL